MLQRDIIAFTISLTDIKDENGHTLIQIEGKDGHRSSLFIELDNRHEDGTVQNLEGQSRQETADRPAKKPPENPRYL